MNCHSVRERSWRLPTLVDHIIGGLEGPCCLVVRDTFLLVVFYQCWIHLIQLLQFVLTEQKVSLPILQKINDDSCSNDDKASLFLKSINDDIILLTALRQDKWQHEGKGIMCGWDSFDFFYSVNYL